MTPPPGRSLDRRSGRTSGRGAPVVAALACLAGVTALGIVLVLRRDGILGRGGNRPVGEFSYDVAALFEVDPALVLCEEAARFDTGLREPRGIAVSRAGIVAVVGDEALRAFDGTGASLAEASLAAAPRCVAEGSDGTFLVGFKGHVEVHTAGTWTRAAVWESLGEKAFLVSIAASPRWVYVADAGQRVVWRCEPSGKPAGTLGKKDDASGIPGFVLPSPHLDVAVAPDGLVRIANPGRHRIEAYAPEGHLELSWGKPTSAIEGFAGCCNPCNFALLPDGSFVTCEKGIPRVKIYDPRGAFVGVVAGAKEFAEGQLALAGDWRQGSGGGLDVAVDPEGRILVLDPIARVVKVFVRKRSARLDGRDATLDG